MPYECFFKITSRLPEVEVFVVGSLNIAFSARQSLITVPMRKPSITIVSHGQCDIPSIDIVGPFLSDQKMEYIIMFVDCFSKYCIPFGTIERSHGSDGE